METIIGLLFILLPVIFKLIGNKLEKSGQIEKAGKVRELAKAFGSEDEPEAGYDDDGQIIDMPPVQVMPESVEQPVPQPFIQPIQQPQPIQPQPIQQPQPVQKPKQKVQSKTIMPVEEKAKKEKIDPKKLVIYSEIMEPKYK